MACQRTAVTRTEGLKMATCPVCGMMADEATAPSSEYNGTTYYFHMPVHKEMFDKDPEKFLSKSSEQGEGMSDDMDMG
jgi:YHS domain-containing protein